MLSQKQFQAIVAVCLMGMLLTVVAIAARAKSNGASAIEVRKGQTFEIRLDSNPTTGYVWEVVEINAQIVQQTGEDFVPSGTGTAETPLLGAGGQQVFQFCAVGTGRTTLKLIYHRPWEKDVEPLKTQVVEIIVG